MAIGLRAATDPGMSFSPAHPAGWQQHQRPAPLLQGQSWPRGLAPSGSVCGLWAWTPGVLPQRWPGLQKEGQSGWSQPAATSPPCCRAQRVSPSAKPRHSPSVTPFTLECQGLSHCQRVHGTPACEGLSWAAAPPRESSGRGVHGCLEVAGERGRGHPGRAPPAHSPLKVQGHKRWRHRGQPPPL